MRGFPQLIRRAFEKNNSCPVDYLEFYIEIYVKTSQKAALGHPLPCLYLGKLDGWRIPSEDEGFTLNRNGIWEDFYLLQP